MSQNYTPDAGPGISSHYGTALRQSVLVAFPLSFKFKPSKLCSLLLVILGLLSTGKILAQTTVFLAPNAAGTGDGSNWTNAAKGDTYFANVPNVTSLPSPLRIYMKEGSYSYSLGISMNVGLYFAIKGGYPTAATLSDTSGYEPVAHVTNITINNTPYGMFNQYINNVHASIQGITFIKGNGTVEVVQAAASLATPSALNTGGIWRITDVTANGFNNAPISMNHKSQTLYLTNCSFQNNVAVSGYAGAVFVNANSTLNVNKCSFVGNVANNLAGQEFGGGAIYFMSGTANISNSYFCTNSAGPNFGGNGGALSSPSYNNATGNPGSKSTVWNITNSTFSRNHAYGLGGAICSYSGDVNCTGCKFYNNDSQSGGGAIASRYGGSTSTIDNCVFYKNYYLQGYNAAYQANSLVGGGGAISKAAEGSWIVKNSIFDQNYSQTSTGYFCWAGAIYYDNTASVSTATTFSVLNNRFYNNTISGYNTSYVASSVSKGSDLLVYSDNTSLPGFTNITGNYLQLGSAAAYQNWTGTGGTVNNNYTFTGSNTFNNTSDGGLGDPTVGLTCPTAINALCNAGTTQVPLSGTALSNICPAVTANLNSLTTTAAPSGTTLEWYANAAHTGSPVTASAVTAGTYYAFYHDIANSCFNTAASTAQVTVTINPCATGTIDCAKTQIFPAPVQGTASQLDLMVTVNVTTAGVFTPTVSGSGMSLAMTGFTITATSTGIQTFHIPIKYDGTTLGTMTFGVAPATPTCTADLTKTPKGVITTIWTLDCVPTVGPTFK